MTSEKLFDILKSSFKDLKELLKARPKPYVVEITSSHILGYSDPSLRNLAGDNFKPFTKSFATEEARADFLRQYQNIVFDLGLYRVVDRVEGNKTIVGFSLTPRDPTLSYQLYSFDNKTY